MQAPTLSSLLRDCVELKSGSKELALFYDPVLGWSMEIGNPSTAVMLGEISGEIGSALYETPEEAAQDVYDQLVAKR